MPPPLNILISIFTLICIQKSAQRYMDEKPYGNVKFYCCILNNHSHLRPNHYYVSKTSSILPVCDPEEESATVSEKWDETTQINLRWASTFNLAPAATLLNPPVAATFPWLQIAADRHITQPPPNTAECPSH